MYNNLIERFISYIKINTRSDPNSNTIPSTESQIGFARKLEEELRQIGMQDVKFNEKSCFVTATLKSNTDKKVKTIGLMAHMDTADFNSEGVKPNFVENYDGESDIILNKDKIF